MPKFYKPKFTIAKAGDYEVTIEHAESKLSRAGTEMTVLDVRVPGSVRFKGHLFWEGNALLKVEQCLIACRMVCEQGAEVDAQEFVGKTARAHVGIRTSPDGREFNYIEEWLPPSGSPPCKTVVPDYGNKAADAANQLTQSGEEEHSR